MISTRWMRSRSGLAWSLVVALASWPAPRWRKLARCHLALILGWIAVVVNVLGAWWTLYPEVEMVRVVFRVLWALLQASWYGLRSAHGTKAVMRSRRAACFRCPLFHWGRHGRILGTCGKPGAMLVLSDQPKGCWCITRFSAWLPQKRCWGREQRMGFGWDEPIQ